MSAICGIYDNCLSKTPAKPDTLSLMMIALTHYGREGGRTWQSDKIALGHQMTHSAPESMNETQPLACARLSITTDARLDNRDELCALFSISQRERETISDSELILRAYQKWGVDCPKHLLGDFAFALWDEREERLFCARDYPGTRAFYYYAGDRQFIFASDIEGVLAVPCVPQDLDFAYLAAHLKNTSHFPHSSRTFFAKIRKLPPAHAMTLDERGVKIWAFWKAEVSPEVRYRRNDDYVEHLAELYTRAVADRTRSAFQVGAHISSGLDSSSVAILASRALQKEGKNLAGGFSWSPPLEAGQEYLENDDRVQIIEMAEKEGFPTYFTSLTTQDMAQNQFGRQAIPLSTALHELHTCREAEKQGIRTMLSGWGGDELIAFNGRGFFLEMLRRGHWRTCFGELKMRADLHGASLRSGVISKLIMPWIPDELIVKLRPKGQLAQTIARRRGMNPLALFKDEFRAQLDAAEKLQKTDLSEALSVRAYQLGLVAHGHITMRIEGWAALGARYGITYAYPLLDRRIVEFALGIPPDMFMKSGWKRWLFREALEGILPDEVRWNPSKDDPALDSNRKRRQEMAQTQVVPLLHNTLLEWMDTGGKFRILEAEQVRKAIATYQPLVFEENTPPSRDKLPPVVKVEELLNPALAEAIQTQINGRNRL